MRKNCMITPEGTRDLLFEECLVRRYIEDKITDVYKKRGFYEVITPDIEFLDVFNLKSYNIPQELMYKLVDSKGRLIVMRPDSTMPIARLVSTRLKNQGLPLRLFYMQNVFTVSPALRGRNDQVMQSGVEIIGASSFKSDLEMITTATDALDACGCEQYRIEIGHIGIYNELIKKLDVTEQMSEQIRKLIEIKNYPMLNDVLEQLPQTDVANALKQLPRLFGGYEVFEKATEVLGNDSKINEILDYLKGLYKSLQKHSAGSKISVDLGIVNRNDYYTGIIFRGYISGYGETAVSGGRYDKLLDEFGYDQPAVGFAINIDALSKAILDKNSPDVKSADVLVLSEQGYEIEALSYAKALTNEGKYIENSMYDTLDKAIEYAKEKGICSVAVVGETVKTYKVGGSENE